MARKWRVGLGHAVFPLASGLLQRGVGEPFVADGDGVALLRRVTALFEEAARVVAGINGKLFRATAAGEFFQRVDQHGGDPLPSRRRMYIEHVDLVLAF